MNKDRARYFFPIKIISVSAVIISAVIFMSFSLRNEVPGKAATNRVVNNDSAGSVKAFLDVYKVLMSPRCVNCHPSGDVPLQGDDSQLHNGLPKRGKDGKGLYAMKCSNCHQPTNVEGLNKPPGHPDWHLPPADMKMVFQGRTAAELARQLVDPKTNGNKTLQQLIAHADDGLVKAGWNPGEGRTVPPLSHEEFKKAWITWIEKGAFAPNGEGPGN